MKKVPYDLSLTPEQIRHHYEVEKELADRLRHASKEERRSLYSSVYNELFRRIPYHPQLVQKVSPAIKTAYVRKQLVSLKRFLNRQTVFLEIGAGDCALSFAVSKLVRHVYALEVSDEIVSGIRFPDNCTLLLSDGSSIPVEPETVTFAYSHQLMEHLHPDDALDQLKNIYAALVKSGKYFCITPNKAYGPHDISKYFEEEATGFHLKEYTIRDLSALLKQVGFSKIRACFGGRSRFILVPVRPLILLERVLNRFPPEVRRSKFARPFLQNRLIAIK